MRTKKSLKKYKNERVCYFNLSEIAVYQKNLEQTPLNEHFSHISESSMKSKLSSLAVFELGSMSKDFI